MALTWRIDEAGGTVFTVTRAEEVEHIFVFLLREYGIKDLRDFNDVFPDGVMLEAPFDSANHDITKSEGMIFHYSHRATRR